MKEFSPVYDPNIEDLPIDFSILSYDEELLSERDGLFMNHEYMDIRGYFDWDDVKQFISLERQLLQAAERTSNTTWS
jgi:hypothetical protein